MVRAEVSAEPGGIDFSNIGGGLDALGYSVLRTAHGEDAVSRSLALIHSWRAGELLLVDNHTMLHSRAPFAGLRHMLRFRYDDPLHPTVIIGRCDT